ncbi:hypothetical protein G6W47_17610 [Streptomyces sp. CAI-21]|uniref:protein phosphatase 2C domain-containing protein n=1 Tax=Streptomyces TaxID=1883 RepID=UPI00047777F9|nr:MULTISPECIES: protein phosphatase 2C domain-containing protein [Streptomyces]MYX82778.1 hypothetical protein [Streptomyces sp. SID4915]NUW08725.1 hypothetical protein [Streptomyces sp. CAI-21]QHC17977.1 hypothetical protein GR131_22465 [Streptomyces sp. GF20]RZF08853.1 hypothetical protein C0R05_08780 [Streptomyces albidoflavus]WAC98617.1 protein phosphatase 2C domain-containing protein [Streptomyces sp. NA13]
MQTEPVHIDLTTEPGAPDHPNEDYCSVALPAHGHGGCLVLLDGVTPPEGDDGCVHSVDWFTARLGGALGELSVSRRDMTLEEILAEAVARTAGTHRSTCDLSHPRTPQATVVLARWDEEAVEHLVLSDSTLLLERADGTLVPVQDPRLDTLPSPVPELRAAVRALPGHTPAARREAAVQEYVEAVEALRNAEGGFHTAAADPAVARLAVTGRTPRAELRSLTAMTDGATRWVDRFGGTWAGTLDLVRTQGTAHLVQAVRDLEHAVPSPRGKRHDDATAVHVAF